MPGAPAFLGKFSAVRRELSAMFLERDEVVEGALCALLARAHVLLVGPPGTAKSLLAHELCRRIEEGVYFQWLLTRFTTPEELFGAVSLKALERDEYRRVTDGKLPEAHISFLDEVFKASSSILNALLTVMNERIFHNGRVPEPVPLLTLFGASNELPDEDELMALYDRFLLRFAVDYLEEDFRFLQMLQLGPPATRTAIRLEELTAAMRAAAEVAVPESVLQDLASLRRDLGRKGIVASDRRYRQSLDVLRARAWLSGREAVSTDDLTLLQHVLWSDPEERREVQASLHQLLAGHEEEARQLLAQAHELKAWADRPWDTEDEAVRAVVEAMTKIRRVGAKLEELAAQARARGRNAEAVDEARAELAALEKAIKAEHLSEEEQ
jgi:MoxR-like ATPase